MRILVVSDIHSNFPALEAVLRDAGEYDIAICAGDIVGYGPYPMECVEKLFFNNFRCIQGNHDQAVAVKETDWFNDDAKEAIRINRTSLTKSWLNWLRRLPLGISLILDGLMVSVFHGSPTEPLTSYIYEEIARDYAENFFEVTNSDLIILGHTHIPYCVESKGRYIINPGSVGQPRDGDPNSSYMILNLNPIKIEKRRVEYNIDATAEAIDSQGIPYRLASRLYRGY